MPNNKTVRTTKVITMRSYLSTYLGEDDFRYNYLSHQDIKLLNIDGVKTLPNDITDIYPNVFITGLAFRVIDCNNNIEVYKKPWVKLEEDINFRAPFEEEALEPFMEEKYEGLGRQIKLGGIKW